MNFIPTFYPKVKYLIIFARLLSFWDFAVIRRYQIKATKSQRPRLTITKISFTDNNVKFV